MTCDDGFHTWTLGLMALLKQLTVAGDIQSGHSVGVCNLGSCLPLRPCTPLGLHRWVFDS